MVVGVGVSDELELDVVLDGVVETVELLVIDVEIVEGWLKAELVD